MTLATKTTAASSYANIFMKLADSSEGGGFGEACLRGEHVER